MKPFLRACMARAASATFVAVLTAGAGACLALDRPTITTAATPDIVWSQFNRWENGSIEAMMGSANVGFTVFMPLAYHCRAPVIRSVSELDVVTVYRGQNVRNWMPLGAAVPPVPKSARVDTAISGRIYCESHNTANGATITLRLVDIELSDVTFRQIGPVDGIAAATPP